jgi:hypothetical protein
MEVGMAVVARDTGTLARLADLANGIVSNGRCTYTFDQIEPLRVREFGLGHPECAIHVNPIVVRGAFEWLTGQYRAAFFSLLLPILFASFVYQLLLHPLFFSLPVCLLLVRDLRRLIKFLLCQVMRAQNAIVVLNTSVTCGQQVAGKLT